MQTQPGDHLNLIEGVSDIPFQVYTIRRSQKFPVSHTGLQVKFGHLLSMLFQSDFRNSESIKQQIIFQMHDARFGQPKKNWNNTGPIQIVVVTLKDVLVTAEEYKSSDSYSRECCKRKRMPCIDMSCSRAIN